MTSPNSNDTTYVACSQCRQPITVSNAEGLRASGQMVRMRCLSALCGHTDWYSPMEFVGAPSAQPRFAAAPAAPSRPAAAPVAQPKPVVTVPQSRPVAASEGKIWSHDILLGFSLKTNDGHL